MVDLQIDDDHLEMDDIQNDWMDEIQMVDVVHLEKDDDDIQIDDAGLSDDNQRGDKIESFEIGDKKSRCLSRWVKR